MENTRFFREEIAKTGFEFEERRLLIPFSVVPKGKARIRTQVSAPHLREDLQFALEKFAEAKAEVGI